MVVVVVVVLETYTASVSMLHSQFVQWPFMTVKSGLSLVGHHADFVLGSTAHVSYVVWLKINGNWHGVPAGTQSFHNGSLVSGEIVFDLHHSDPSDSSYLISKIIKKSRKGWIRKKKKKKDGFNVYHPVALYSTIATTPVPRNRVLPTMMHKEDNCTRQHSADSSAHADARHLRQSKLNHRPSFSTVPWLS